LDREEYDEGYTVAMPPAPISRSGRAAGIPCASGWLSIIYNHMVVRSSLSTAEVDRLFRALADGTRRDIVARLLSDEPASVSALASRYDMSFAAVQKHVAVLEEAGLVTKHPQGRERIVRGNPERLAQARALLLRLEQLWVSRFRQLDAILAEPRSSKD
jgi:DNA-binding transcriptional ArsR family regulator